MATRGIPNWIKIPDLKDGYLYRISARNAEYGMWSKETSSFIISRIKFGDNYLFNEYHWDPDSNFGTVKPLEEIEHVPKFETPLDCLNYLNSFND